MEIIGIIAEYNPFHAGHAWQLQKIREVFPHAAIVVAMSGSFVQRGEPACVDKWTRATWAVRHGADLVVELPAVFVLRSAERFAAGGIRLLSALPCTHLAFGAETPDLVRLQELAAPIDPEKLQEKLASGLTYGAATTALLAETVPDAAELLSTPNNLLAVAYLRAIRQFAPHLRPVPILRSRAPEDEISGAVSGSLVRESLANGVLPHAMLTEQVSADLEQLLAAGHLSSLRDYETIALAQLRLLDEPPAHGEFSEGLENRWWHCRQATGLPEFWQAVKSKRYPHARLRRLTAQTMLRLSAAALARADELEPQYIRPLAFTGAGTALLKRSLLPVLTRPAQQLTPEMSVQFRFDCRATDLAALCRPTRSPGGNDYTRSPELVSG